MVDIPAGPSAGKGGASLDVLMDYDEEADVLYLSFEKPQQATDSVMGGDGNVYHYRRDRLVGVTILRAHRQAQQPDG